MVARTDSLRLEARLVKQLVISIVVDGQDDVLGVLEEVHTNVVGRACLSELKLKVSSSSVQTQRILLIEAPRRMIEASSCCSGLPRALQAKYWSQPQD